MSVPTPVQPTASDPSVKSSSPPTIDRLRDPSDNRHEQGQEPKDQTFPAASEIKPATHTYVVNNSAPPGLDGLRTLLAEWNREAAKTRMEGTGTKERVLTGYQQDTAKNLVYTEYQKMAIQEDKELVTRWTETLNILLTFAGLLSAIITAFLLASQTDLEPKPNELTDKILLHIAHQFDNITDTSQFAESHTRSDSTVRILGYWHASLGCSLFSAFGSLLSKQWVLHYQSTPGWANTLEQQCHLREIRAYGLSKWRMHAIIESLPVLLQLAVFLFYLGLAESVHSTPALFRITNISSVAIAVLYIFTLVTGAFFSSCPFRSPLTDVFYQAVGFLLILLLLFLFIPLGFLKACLNPSKASHTLTVLGTSIKTAWRRLLSLRRDSPSHSGERSLTQGARGAAGVMFWWLQESGWSAGWNTQDFTWAKMMVVTGIIRATPAEEACTMAIWRGGFGSWCYEVFVELLRGNYPSPFALLEADVVCHLIHHSTEGVQAVRNALIEYGMDGDPSKTLGYVCDSLRKGWADPYDISTEPKPLPIANMEPSILSTYLRLQLIDWSYTDSASRSNRELLLQELPVALKQNYFPHSPQYLDSIIDAVSLVAVALVPEDGNTQIKPVKGLVNSPQLERLLQALHRLSYYPNDGPPTQLMSLAVAAAANVLRFNFNAVESGNKAPELYECATWEKGELAEILHRLSKLGRSWYTADETPNRSLGASLVHQLCSLKNALYSHSTFGLESGFIEAWSVSSAELDEVFALYAHPDAPTSLPLMHLIEATKLLDRALSHRSILPPSGNPPRLTWSKDPPFTPKLEDNLQVIQQLISNINIIPADPWLRQLSLSIVVKGHDVFFHPSIANIFPDLVSDIRGLSDWLHQENHSLGTLPENSYKDFNKWGELLDALKESLRQAGHLEPKDQDTSLETATEDKAPLLLGGLAGASKPKEPSDAVVALDALPAAVVRDSQSVGTT